MAFLDYFTRKPKPTTIPPAKAPSTAPARPLLSMRSHGVTDRGLIRDTNEDCFVIADLARTLNIRHSNLSDAKSTYSCHRGYVFLVADGVGGSSAGEIASGLSVRSIEEFLLNTLKRFSNLQASEEQAALRDLQDALFQADSRIFEEVVEHPEWRGMGTTLTMAFAVNWRLFVAHAGDSRCYLFSGGRLQQITQDHTVTAEMVRRGIISPQCQATHPWRHVVTNILGGSERGVQAELHSIDLHEGDVILLCSDGLSDLVPEERIVALLQAESEPMAACECLVKEANGNGGKDNITAVVARVEHLDQQSAKA